MRTVLVLNAGSSSLKVAAFDGSTLRRTFSRSYPTAEVLDEVLHAVGDATLTSVGHRVVHGGDRFAHPARVTPAVLAGLRELASLDPDHLPAEIALIEQVASRLPDVPQVACFDTAFHHAMPRVAATLPIPRRFGLRRYGFHGLSYTYLMGVLGREAPEAARGRVVLAHLGAGASLAAVRGGDVVDTTMGFTPTSGIPMATRTGDLDPGVMLHWMRSGRLHARALDDLVNRESGLLGVSETTGDMRELLASARSDPRAAEAVDLFCYQAKKAIGALAAAMGGVETLVFSGGIGAHAPPVRARIAAGLEHLGIAIDESHNERGASIVSTAGAACTVRVIPTDEESVIVRQTLEVLS